jgi:hypothetical protein
MYYLIISEGNNESSRERIKLKLRGGVWHYFVYRRNIPKVLLVIRLNIIYQIGILLRHLLRHKEKGLTEAICKPFNCLAPLVAPSSNFF